MELKKYKIEKLGAFGEGVAHDDGKVVFIAGALSGEEVLATPTLVKKSFTKAKLKKILSASPNRIKPQCKYFYNCGGCALQHLSYDAQLKLKVQSISETLKKVGGVDIKIDEIVPSKKQFRYRNKLSFPVRNDKIGMYEENSHNVVDVEDCLLQKEWNAKLITALRAFMRDYGLSGYDEKKGDVRHIVAREKDGSVCVTLVTAKQIKIDDFINYISFSDFALYQNVNGENNNVILSDEFYFIGGKGKFPAFHPASFYQVNDEIEEKLYAEVLKECDGKTVIDAYCGAGNLTLEIAKKATEVFGIEICKQAVDEANQKASIRHAENVSFICGDCKTEFSRIASKNLKDVTVVFDPPRKGVDENTLCAALELEPKKIVYVSCNPATLARDVKILSQKYEIKRVAAFDMFPQTTHVETLVVLLNKEADERSVTVEFRKEEKAV